MKTLRKLSDSEVELALKGMGAVTFNHAQNCTKNHLYFECAEGESLDDLKRDLRFESMRRYERDENARERDYED